MLPITPISILSIHPFIKISPQETIKTQTEHTQ